jgi:hypothetical protein
VRDLHALRGVSLPDDVALALSFHLAPLPRPADRQGRGTVEPMRRARPQRQESAEDLAFSPVTILGELLRTRQVSSTELTKLDLERLRQHDPLLHCVVTPTDKLAQKQAARADQEIAAASWVRFGYRERPG